jgi:poly-gamma-glutamate synthesis protein (capsule biosynthesis protein)
MTIRNHGIRIILILAAALMLFGVAGCLNGDSASPEPHPGRTDAPGGENAETGQPAPSDPKLPAPAPAPEPERPEPVIQTATFAAIGDILIHSSIYKDAKTESGYDFVPMFAKVRSYIESADLALANQETMIGGAEIGLSDYPTFNSPYEVGDALKEIGIDVVSLANNHTLDRGEKAIVNALAHWNKLEIPYVGAYLSEEDRNTPRIVTKNGISFAFLAYTYGTNGIPVPKGKPYLVELIDPDKVKQDIERVRKLADVVVVSVHFGQEYADLPNEAQKRFARGAAEAGADMIIGHHPHVLQPVEWMETGDGRKSFVIYSLGNFIAGQEGERKRTGGILSLEIVKTSIGGESRIELRNPAFVPTWISMKNWRNYSVVPLWDAPKDQLAKPEAYFETIRAHMSRWMPELAFPQ